MRDINGETDWSIDRKLVDRFLKHFDNRRVNLESIFNYTTHHSESMIQWVLLAILLLVGFLTVRGLLSKNSGAAGDTESLASPELQSMINKIMEQTSRLEAIDLKSLPAAGLASVDAQVQDLKKNLAARDSELSHLKSGGGAVGEDGSNLSTRIKELEAKLAEYEILEDDIADLSLYKEENVRLKSELDKARSAGGSVAPNVEATATAEEPAVETPSVETPDIVAEFAQAIETAPVAESEPVVPEVAAQAPVPASGNPMTDFENTVEQERKPQPAAAQSAGSLPQMPPVEAAKPTEEAKPVEEANDLFAEFSTAKEEAIPEFESSELDTDKMMAEMAELVSIEPSASNALEESIDIEKMAVEARKES